MTPALSAEMQLALTCCRWPRPPEADELVRSAAGDVVDWALFDAIVRRNRITPLVHDALARAGAPVPGDLWRELSSRGRVASRRALSMARESLRLQQAFDEARIPLMVVKGVSIGILAYGQLAMKESSDIDVLVSPEHAVQGLRLLAGLGYRLEAPKLEPDEFERFVEFAKEASFYSEDNRLTVELHWRLVDHRTLMRGVSANGPAQMVRIPGGELRSLADEPLFAYLCLHGALHNWCRLKWLTDVNAFLGSRPQSEIVRLLAAAEDYGAGRSASVAVMLCERLLGLEPDPVRHSRVERNSTTQALHDNVIAGLLHRGGGIEQDSYSLPWIRMKTAQFFVARGRSHLGEQLRVAWTVPPDQAPNRVASTAFVCSPSDPSAHLDGSYWRAPPSATYRTPLEQPPALVIDS